jgi:hypothetical protein
MCWVTETACSKGVVPQIRVVVLVVKVGMRLGASGGEGTLKSRPQTTPKGQKLGSALGHPLAAGLAVGLALGLADALALGADRLALADALASGLADMLASGLASSLALGLPPVNGDAAFPLGITVPTRKDMAHSAMTRKAMNGLALPGDRGRG